MAEVNGTDHLVSSVHPVSLEGLLLLLFHYYYFFFSTPCFFPHYDACLKQVEATDICQIGLELIIEIISHKCRKQLIYSGNWYLLIFQFGYLKDIFSIFYSF